MSLTDWTFEPAEHREGGYQVTGRYQHARTYYGESAPDGVGFDATGMLVGPVTGVGATPEAALAAAVYAAGKADEQRDNMARRANAAGIGGHL